MIIHIASFTFKAFSFQSFGFILNFLSFRSPYTVCSLNQFIRDFILDIIVLAQGKVLDVKLRMWWFLLIAITKNEDIDYGFPVEDFTKIESFGVATQESTAYGGIANRAIDGNTEGGYASETCTHTMTRSSTTWWKLSFPVHFQVEFIALWNRGGDGKAIAERIDQAKIYMENKLCETLEYKDGLNPNVIKCGAHSVKEISVVGNHILTLCEVEVFSSDSPPVNIAKYGKASQSTVGWGGLAHLAIDGDTHGSFHARSGTCTHTIGGECTESEPEWWMLEFTTDVQVDWINVWNRDLNGEYNAKRIDGLEVYADNNFCGAIEYSKGTRPYRITCENIIARNITMEFRGKDDCIITLCEVEVFTKSLPIICTGTTVPNGILRPMEVIEGSMVTLECDKEFKTKGKWQFVCINGSFEIENDFPECVPIYDQDCVIDVEGGFLKKKCQDSSRRTFKCANSPTKYDVVPADDGTAAFSDICSADHSFYQPCGFNAFSGESIDGLICGEFVCQTAAANKSNDCKSHQAQSNSCNNLEAGETKTCPTKPETSNECDLICNEGNCIDEAQCNGLIYGIYCDSGFYIPIPQLITLPYRLGHKCHVYDPYPGDREKYLENYDGPVCQHEQGGQTLTMPIFNFTRCATFKYDLSVVADTSVWWVTSTKVLFCSDLMDQTNCTDPSRIALFCKSNGFRSSVSIFAICHGFRDIRICDDGIENDCKQLTPSCYVHKHKMCDGVADCEDSSDENNHDCKEMVGLECVRILGNASLPIPLAWLGDGITDCGSKIDENPAWPACGEGETKRYVMSNDSCSDDFLCSNSQIKFIPLDRMCDMIDTCGNENLICKMARGKPDLFTVSVGGMKSKSIAFPVCFPGVESLQELSSNCSKSYFQYPPASIYGIDNSKEMLMPSRLHNCENFFGEMYLYASCKGKCRASQCPLSRTLKYDSCPGQYPKRIFTLANMDYLTFVTPSGGSFHNDYFLCRNSRCVSFERVCDLVDDCGDSSDEEMCNNQFRCNTSNTRIPKWQLCDGKINCEDMTDECNETCGKEIIEGIPLKIAAWLMGFLAMLFNCYTCIQSAISLNSTKTLTGLLNKLLIMFVGIGDFLVGAYLFAIAVIDTVYGSSYCFMQYEWLSSNYCSILGIVSTIGSQISLFSMTCLSIARLYGIINSMSFGSSKTCRGYMQVILILMIIVGASVGVAVAPVLPQFEDFFVNGLTYSSNNPLFVGSTNKKVHFQIIQAYYGRARGAENSVLSWKKITRLIDGMFSSLYGGLEKRKVDFYGNDGVCLFKYFVSDEDPQKIFSWSVLTVNFICFIVISMSYFIINVRTVQSGKVVNNQQVNDRNRAMQRKVTLIIATDFLCWVPFVIICCLHSLSVVDATPWYALFSLVILPINSVINPLLYDMTLTAKIIAPVRSVRQRTMHSFSSIKQKRRNHGQESEQSQRNDANLQVGQSSFEMSKMDDNSKNHEVAVMEEKP